jgi:lysophospholipase L1-like esterase
MPTKPARWYAHESLEFMPASGWGVLSVRKSGPLARYAGPSGFALQSTGVSRATVRLHEVAPDARFELFFLRQPDGGTVVASFDQQSSTSWSTRGALGAGYSELGVSPAPHLISIDTPGDGVVTLFGLTLEHGVSGVVLDTLGIPGARARDHLLWDDPLYREHLRKRSPALVVMAYGTNEGMDSDEPLELYESQTREVIRRIRTTLPSASCLLVGPTDHPQKRGRAKFGARRRTGLIVNAQRKIAAESGCAFIDLVAVTGGPMSMMRLVQAHLGARDHTHFTRRGYEALGDAISAALVGKYLTWQRATCREPGVTARIP